MSLLKYCKSCGNQIPEARVKILPHAVFCVPCAEGRVGRKKAITFLEGQGDHAATAVHIVDEHVAQAYAAPELRDVLDIEPEEFAKEEGRPIKIKKRNELG